MRSPRTLTVISLGGGVQSSVMALMAGGGGFDSVPDRAIFADTRWEPPSTCTRPEGLESRLQFPIYVVDNGRSPTCIPCGCPSPMRSCWMRQTWERATREAGSATSARVTVASGRAGGCCAMRRHGVW